MNNKTSKIVTYILYFIIGLYLTAVVIKTLQWIDNIQQSVQSVTLENKFLKQEVEELKETIVDLQNNQEEIDNLKETVNNQQEQINEIK